MKSLAERFWTKVDCTGDCWMWTGTAPAGYGQIRVLVDGHWKNRKATHVSWCLAFGVWPQSMLLHSCDTPRCVNPRHLSEGDARRNKREEIDRGRNSALNRTHCPAGHLYDDLNTYHWKRKLHSRRCRICNAIKAAEYRERRDSKAA